MQEAVQSRPEAEVVIGGLGQKAFGQRGRTGCLDSGSDLFEIRSKLLAFAKRLALQITGKHDPTEVKDRIDSAVRELLTNLSKYRACDYYRRSKTRELDQEQSQDEPQREQEERSTGRVGWKKGRPRPEASESNRQRWATNPEKLTETLGKMNAAKQAAADSVRRKISAAAKKRWATIPLEQKLAHLEKMRAARRQKSPPR